MKKICFITPEDAAFGFGMAGIEQRTTAPQQAEDALRQAISDGGSGLVVLDERLLASIAEETLRLIEQRWPGILVVLPAPAAAELGPDYVNRLVARAIGYQVRLD
jgi:V/A-type H+-transporting ATPase subunit F